MTPIRSAVLGLDISDPATLRRLRTLAAGGSFAARLALAFVYGKGLRLTAEEVAECVHDDAIGTRINNEILGEP